MVLYVVVMPSYEIFCITISRYSKKYVTVYHNVINTLKRIIISTTECN